MKKLLLAALLLSGPASAQTEAEMLKNPTSANLELKYGFRGLRFETDTTHIEGLHRLAGAGAGQWYSRPADRLFVGDARVSITYGFVLGRFASVQLTTTQRADSERLLLALRGLYGQEDLLPAPVQTTFPFYRQWTTARCQLRFEMLADGSGRASLASTKLYEFYETKQKGRPAVQPGDL